MKLAIIGNSPIALEAAVRFHLHGASLTWFKNEDYTECFNEFQLSEGGLISDLGLEILKSKNLKYDLQNLSMENWRINYFSPINEVLSQYQEIKTDEVVSITKRFLAPEEEILGRTRFLDLFRVIFKVDPTKFIEEQKDDNPETYKKLSEEFVKSLASSIEMYQDYDVVLDFRTNLGKASVNIAGRALGEGRQSESVFYDVKALKKARTITPGPELREIALVGSHSLSAEMLISLEEWLKDPRSNLFIISHEEEPFNNFLVMAQPSIAKKIKSILATIEQEHKFEIESFTKKLREWQELDDFVRLKIPRPVEPIPRLNFFSGHNVTAIDELIDRKRIFLTLEKPEFRRGKIQPENNNPDLKTLGADLVLVGHCKKDRSNLEIKNNESGFFELIPEMMNIKNFWEEDLTKLEGIEDEIFKLFSPANSH